MSDDFTSQSGQSKEFLDFKLRKFLNYESSIDISTFLSIMGCGPFDDVAFYGELYHQMLDDGIVHVKRDPLFYAHKVGLSEGRREEFETIMEIAKL